MLPTERCRHRTEIEAPASARYDESPGAGESKDLADLALSVDERDVAGNGADRRERKMKDEKGRPVRKLEDDHVSRAEAVPAKTMGDVFHQCGDFAVGEAAVHRIHDQFPVRVPLGDSEQPVVMSHPSAPALARHPGEPAAFGSLPRGPHGGSGAGMPLAPWGMSEPWLSSLGWLIR